MTEKDFTTDLIRGLTAQGAYAEKWPDLARAVKKPYDIAMAYGQRFYPIECKLRDFHDKERLPGKTVVLSPADFRGRQHQLPGLLKMFDRGQADPYVAAFIVVYREFKQPLKHGWLIPVVQLKHQDTFTLNECIARQSEWGLKWVPNIGWTASWLPEASAERLKQDRDPAGPIE